MGIVQKQGLQNTLFSYLGVLLGYVNQYILFAQILKFEKMGLAVMLLSAAVIFAELSKVGNYVMIFRFFPFFKHREEEKKEFTFLTTVVLPLVGMTFFTVLFLLFREPIIARFAVKCPLFAEYYLYLFPIGYGLTLIGTFTIYAQANLKSVVPTAIFEIGVRSFHTIAVLVFWMGWANFEGFLTIYTSGYLLNFFILLGYLIWLKRWKIVPKLGFIRSRFMKIVLSYGLFNYFTRSANIIVEQTGVLQVGELMGESNAAVYQIAFYLSLLVSTPFRSMNTIVNVLMAQHLQKKDYVSLKSLYQKSSINGMIAALFVYIGILTNVSDLFEFLHLDVPNGMAIFAVVGLGRLIDVTNGANYGIVIFSKHYRLTLISTLSLVALTIFLNYTLIPMWGAIGAGVAAASALFLFNAFNTYLVWRFFNMQPFMFKHIEGLVIAGITIGIAFLIPSIGHPIVSMLLRGVVTTIVFGGLTWWWNISEDANDLLRKVIKRIK